MPRKKTSTASHVPDAVGALVPTESPVPGVKLELGLLLVHAVKARRKFLSKSSSPTKDDDAEREALLNLQDISDNNTTDFLNELKRAVQKKLSGSYASASSSRRGGSNTPPSTEAPVLCVKFLLEIICIGTNSFHLRRSALALTRAVLARSSDARSFFGRGRCLLDFVRMIEGVGNDQSGEEDDRASLGGSSDRLSPRSLFQLEAMELVHEMASKYGNLYMEFTVASRLLMDVSVNCSMHHIILCNRDAPNVESGSSQRANNVRTLRNERNAALECGPKACQILERMVERADQYFNILVPRFGGFNTVETSSTCDSRLAASDDEFASNDNMDCGIDLVDRDNDDDDDGSINWEEGDVELPTDENVCDDNASNSHSFNDHQASVSHTLAVMERSGVLLEGALAIQVNKDNSIEARPMTSTPAGELPVTGQDYVPDEEVAHRKLHNLVVKLYRRLPRLNQWICALSQADGMEERSIVDPITSRPLVSLVLLSKEKRGLRAQFLQRMMNVRVDIEGVVRSSSRLGIVLEESGARVGVTKSDDISVPENGVCHDTVSVMKRPSIPHGSDIMVSNKRKTSKTPRINVIYRNK